MESVPAACLMEWSIELEKALRSKKQCRSIDAIQQFIPKFQKWSREPETPVSAYNMFDLVIGEDKLFANAILLRLVDAFRMGDKETRISVVRVFMSEHRCREKSRTGKRYQGILSHAKVSNQIELIERVKTVFDTGDSESRVLALLLFGCWADFVRDSAHIRYLILSSLISSNPLEVKASLFAAGCLCELVDDFASVVLEMLPDIVISSKTFLELRLCGARVFAKMGNSHSVANKAYKVGMKVVQEASNECVLVAMIVSLSKLASKSTFLLCKQVDFLLSFLGPDNILRLKATASRCFCMLLIGKAHLFNCLSITELVKSIAETIDEEVATSSIQCDSLQIAHKVLLFRLSDMSLDSIEFNHLLASVEDSAQSSSMPKRLLAIRILVDVSTKLKGVTAFRSMEDSPSLQVRVVSIVTECIKFLTKSQGSNVQEIQNLLNLLVSLVKEHPNLAALVLDNARAIVSCMMDSQGIVPASLKPVYFFRNFFVKILENLYVSCAITPQIYNKWKGLVEIVHLCNFFGTYDKLINSILLHSKIIWICDPCDPPSFNVSDPESCALGIGKNMLLEEDGWHAYNVGKFAMAHGVWAAAIHIFEQLVGKVKSDSCSCWLKSLAEFAHSERKIQLSLVPGLISHVNDSGSFFIGLLREAYQNLCSSVEILKSMPMSGKTFYFQIWFLGLRSRLLKVVIDVLNLSHTLISDNKENPMGGLFHSLQQVSQLSLKFKMLAQEFDLLGASSFGGPCCNSSSLQIISVLGLFCSLLSFTTRFPIFISSLPDHGKLICIMGSSRNQLIQDLSGRLWVVDQETCSNLHTLLEIGEQASSCPHIQPGSHILSADGTVREILAVCKYVIRCIVGLRDETEKGQNDRVLTGFVFLLNTTTKLMQICLPVPRRFFKIRPLMGAELFAARRGGTPSQNGLHDVLPGCQLSLDICLQLKDMPPDLQSHDTQLFCILMSSVLFQEPRSDGESNEHANLGYDDWEMKNMVQMNTSLFEHVVFFSNDSICHKRGNRGCDDDDDGIVKGFSHSKPNNRGQGFSSCLLDVSHFPPGSYRVKWHCCLIDSQGSYWSLVPFNAGPIFTIRMPPHVT